MNDEVEILLVEDNRSDAEFAIRALTRQHCADKLLWVRDGTEALDFLYARGAHLARNPHNHPKVIFLDLKMPKADGLDVLKVIKSDESLRLIPVVMLTSSREEADMEACYRLGANSFVSKPVNYDDFVSALAQMGNYWLHLNR